MKKFYQYNNPFSLYLVLFFVLFWLHEVARCPEAYQLLLYSHMLSVNRLKIGSISVLALPYLKLCILHQIIGQHGSKLRDRYFKKKRRHGDL